MLFKKIYQTALIIVIGVGNHIYIYIYIYIFFWSELKIIVNVNKHTIGTCFRPIIKGIASWTQLMKK